MDKTDSSIKIRLATLSDLDPITKLHCKTFSPEEHVPVILGENYVRATYNWLINGSASYALVAEKEKEIIGIVAVCDKAFTLPMFIACFPILIKQITRNPLILLNKKLWQRLFRRPDISKESKALADYPGFAQMTIGAVDRKHRGLGIFPSLVKATVDYGIIRENRAIRAGIYKKNMASRKVFEKLNWVEISELETGDTVFYANFIDSTFPIEVGLLPTQES